MSVLARFPRPNTAAVRFRATAWATVALAALVVVSALAINWLVTREVRSSADAILTEQAADRAQLLAAGAAPETQVIVLGEEVIAAVIAADGTVLASSGTPEPEVLANLPAGLRTVTIVVEEAREGDDSNEEPHDDDIRVATVILPNGSRMVVGSEGDQTRQTIGNVRTVLAIGGPAVALVGGLILWFLTGRALGPVYRMRDDLERVVDRGSDGRVTEPGTRDEIDDLAVTLNHVLAQLEQQSASRRQFVADASHELKSPVANARALIETDGPVTTTLSELDRLQSLVDDLLFLARTDEMAPSAPSVVDLDDVVFDEAERAAIRTGLRIDASGVQPAQVLADRDQVARAVRNLVENAVRHGEHRVTLAVEEGPEAWVVVVVDDGPGIPPADRERIFTRFARLESDRSRGDGGTGLGLSIVEAIATRHGGTVRVADHDGPGARLELTLPRADRAPT